jgi:hypothetical protein
MVGQALEPAQFVIEFRAGPGIAIGQVDTADNNAIDESFYIAAVRKLIVIAGQVIPEFLDLRFSQDRYTVPAFCPCQMAL